MSPSHVVAVAVAKSHGRYRVTAAEAAVDVHCRLLLLERLCVVANIQLHRELLVTLPLLTCSTVVDNKPCCEIFDPKDLLHSCSLTSTSSVLLLDYRFYSGFTSGLNWIIGASSDQGS